MRRLLAALLSAATLVLVSHDAPAQERLTVFAAASTTDAVTELLQRFELETGIPAVGVFASSSTLAKQIEQGAPADLYISANVRWMDHLEERSAIRTGNRLNLLGNGLVVVTARGSGFACDPGAGCDLAAALGDDRLALGDPDHVPAGIYAKQALVSLGQWDVLEPKLARASDVRGALALVERGETPAGVVYATDAALREQVEIVSTLPAESHAPILYPAALVAGRDRPEAQALLRYLTGGEARAIFARFGFTVVAPPTPQG